MTTEGTTDPNEELPPDSPPPPDPYGPHPTPDPNPPANGETPTE